MSEEIARLPERGEIPEEMTWDLAPLYSNTDQWEHDFAKLGKLTGDFCESKGKLDSSPEVLAGAFKKLDELERLLEKIYVHAHLKSDEDLGNSENRGRLDRIMSKYAEIEGEIAWFEPEILDLPEIKFQEYQDSSELKFYRRTLTELERSRKHMLSAPEERILGLASDLFATPRKTFSALNNADMKFPVVKDSEGKSVELTHGNFIKFLEEPEREVRKNAFEGMYDTFNSYRNTFASTLDGTIKQHAFSAKLRSYPSALAAALHSDNLPVTLYLNLISSINDGLPALHRYFKLRTEVMGLDKLDMYDIYNPLAPDAKVEVSWDDACKWVKNAMSPLGEEYGNVLGRAFSERWVDVLECRGKRSGAYSSGCYDSSPYILMNYHGTLNHVFTLAHELGHSMHSYYSNQAQDYHYAGYRIFVAEVASTVNELLLHHYLLGEKGGDAGFRTYLLNHLVDEIRGTVFRQTMFAEFEKALHEQAENSIPLTPDLLCESYYELNGKYHGEFVAPDKRIEMEWARIPHFYYNFYVFKYATGFSAAAALSRKLLDNEPGAHDAYLGFLKAGDTKDVLDIMKDAGVDLTKPEPVQAVIKLFDETVSELAGSF